MAEVVFKKPHALTDVPFHYCPGCTHGIVHRLVAEVIDELGVEGNTTGVASVGCSVYSYNYFNCDMVQAPHGRASGICDGEVYSVRVDIVPVLRSEEVAQ